MEKKKLDRENDKNNIALFRFAVISPLINNTNEYKSKEEFYRKASLKKYELPNGNQITLTPGNIKKWYISYKKDGFDALKSKTRIDTGSSRKIPVECIDKIAAIKEKYP